MKKLVLISALTLGALGIKTANAQIGIHVNLHFGTPVVVAPAPVPPPAPVYDDDEDYYYLPDVEAYYSVPEHCYYYNDGYSWVSAAYLPGYYRNFDWRTARRFEVHGNRPYLRHDSYRVKFGGFTNRADFYARAFPGRDRHDPRLDRRSSGYGNRGNYNDRDRQNGYNQGSRGNYGQQPQNQGNWGQQQGQGRGQGSYNQPANQGSYGQPSGNHDQGRGNHSGQDRGNYGGGQQHVAERVGVANTDRVAANRPARF